MRILIIGRTLLPHYEQGFTNALNDIGVESKLILIRENNKKNFIKRLEDKYPPLLFFDKDIRSKILSAADEFNPEYILFWRPTLIKEYIIKKLRKKGIKILTTNNYDPFNTIFKENSIFIFTLDGSITVG